MSLYQKFLSAQFSNLLRMMLPLDDNALRRFTIYRCAVYEEGLLEDCNRKIASDIFKILSSAVRIVTAYLSFVKTSLEVGTTDVSKLVPDEVRSQQVMASDIEPAYYLSVQPHRSLCFFSLLGAGA